MANILPVMETEATEYLNQLVNELGYLHDFCIHHGDLKPSNIGLTTKNTLKLLDFGFSQIHNFRGAAQAEKINDPAGTLCYNSLEQLREQPYDPFGSDVWSLGITAYEVIAGDVPYIGDSEAKILQEIASPIKFTKNFSKRIQMTICSILSPEDSWPKISGIIFD